MIRNHFSYSKLDSDSISRLRFGQKAGAVASGKPATAMDEARVHNHEDDPANASPGNV